MRVVGLDLSLAATGVATEAGTTTIKTDPGKIRGMARLALIRQEIWGVIADEAGGADLSGPVEDVLVMVEDYAFSRGKSQAHALGELGGVVRMSLHEAGIPWVDVNITHLKIYATGSGAANKDKVLVETMRRFPECDVENNNEADALWLRAIGCALLGEPLVDLPATHRRALENVKLPDTVKTHLHTPA